MKYALDQGHFGYELSTLTDGAEALAFIRREGKYAHAAQPGLIVMDLHLPKNNGIEVLEEIRGNSEFTGLPVAVLSSSVSPEEESGIAAQRATCLITKPTDLDAFLHLGERIKQMALEGKRAERLCDRNYLHATCDVLPAAIGKHSNGKESPEAIEASSKARPDCAASGGTSRCRKKRRRRPRAIRSPDAAPFPDSRRQRIGRRTGSVDGVSQAHTARFRHGVCADSAS